jgi:hypothetical protein
MLHILKVCCCTCSVQSINNVLYLLQPTAHILTNNHLPVTVTSPTYCVCIMMCTLWYTSLRNLRYVQSSYADMLQKPWAILCDYQFDFNPKFSSLPGHNTLTKNISTLIQKFVCKSEHKWYQLYKNV